MRVALLSPLFESVPPQYYGGTERVVFNLWRGLTQAKIEVVLFASGDSKINGSLVPVIDEALRLGSINMNDPNAAHFKMLSLVTRLSHEFDIIHNHHHYWMLPLSEMRDTPMVSTQHGRMDLPELDGVFCGYPRVSFVSISDSQRSFMPDLPWIKTVHHGINVKDFQFYENHGNYLVFLGRISPEKRPDWAIEIALKSGVPLKIAAKIEGEEGRSYYESRVRPYVDGRFIEYVGEISEKEKSEFLGNALALLFPIDWPEPFGLVVIESLACGTPVLARPCGSVPELLKDEVTGFIHSDITVLADRVHDVSKLDRRTCRQWVERRFSIERMTEDYLDVYRQILNREPERKRFQSYSN